MCKVTDSYVLNGITVGQVRASGIVSLSKITSGYIVMPQILLRSINYHHLKLLDDDSLNSLSLSTPDVFFLTFDTHLEEN